MAKPAERLPRRVLDLNVTARLERFLIYTASATMPRLAAAIALSTRQQG
jgi:hypothetical protein